MNQLKDMSRVWLNTSSTDDPESIVHEYMLARTMTLLTHFSTGRGNNARVLNLCDLFSVDVDCVGPSPCHMLGFIDMQGKTNKVRYLPFS